MRTASADTRSRPDKCRVGGLRVFGSSTPILFEDHLRLTVGRTRRCTITIENRSVSRSHCVIMRLPDGRYQISDWQSATGVWISPLGRYSDYHQVKTAILQLGMFIRLCTVKLVTTDAEGCCPMMVARYSEFICENERAYGSATQAESFIGRSRKTIERFINGLRGRNRRGGKQ